MTTCEKLDIKTNTKSVQQSKETNAEFAALSFDDFDEINSPRPEITGFDRVVTRAISRRDLFGQVLSFGLAGFLMGTTALSPVSLKAEPRSKNKFGFKAVAANSKDTVTVPKGFNWNVVSSWGDPLWSDAAEFNEDTRGSASSQRHSFGDNNDGMSVFAHDGKQLLVVNNEYVNLATMFGNRDSELPESSDDSQKIKSAHGVTISEIKQLDDDSWAIVKDSPYNRRITADTEMELTGPAAGHDLLQTMADPAGVSVLGTINNCGNGETPWGTYLTCEENFNGYFSSSDKSYEIPQALKRYGVGAKDKDYGLAEYDERFDVSKHPNEANRFGYVVEIDPRNPLSTPKKRTALGRFKHENAELVLAKDNRVVIYMGDDERGEFLYRFVSRDAYVPGKSTSQLLNKGTLYVAKFYDDLSGAWLPLTPETTGLSPAEISIHTRLAASKVGATTMDRPEWVAAHPNRAELYCALTNNKHRGVKPNKGGDEMPVAGPNPRAKNIYGQILRWSPDKSDHTSSGFRWQIFALAGNPDVHDEGDLKAGSKNITTGNMFNSPDGMGFDSQGRLWIQTDGKYNNKGDFEGMGNNQMLVGDPETGEIRRFLVGPMEAEITGLCWSADWKTMFVGIQHPGEKGNSHFPGGGDSLPRSSVIAVRRDDGAPIG